MHISRLEPLILNVSAKTNWSFFRLTTDTGLQGMGEASLNGGETLQTAFLLHIAPEFEGRPADALGMHR